MMDRALPRAAQRAFRIRRVLQFVVPVTGCGFVIALLPGLMHPTISRDRIRTATVATGSIDAVITASGTLTPEIERVFSSPFDARVVRILRRPGAVLRRGDALAELDLGESILALERILTDLQITDNQEAQARLALDTSLAGIDSHINQKTLDLQILKTRAVSSVQLSTGGLISAQTVQEATLAVKRAEIELEELHTERANAAQATKLRFEGLALQRTALDKAASEARRVLELATTRSDREAVLTWVFPQEGALVRKGDVIARIADLTSFRVDASVSAIHGGRIRTGVPVIVKVNNTHLEGTITDVLPTIENDVMRFIVTLGESSHRLLRPNLRVDVLVIFDRRTRALKVKQGPFSNDADANGGAEVFLVRNDRAMRVPVRFGLRGPDEIEIVSGLHEGDEVVISDMRDYLHLEEIDIR